MTACSSRRKRSASSEARSGFYASGPRDLEEIFWFIAADNPRRARSYIAEIERACSNLCDMPHMGTKRPNLRPGLYIFPLWRRIAIAYELPGNRVDVLRIFSAGQDYEAIMSNDPQADVQPRLGGIE